MSAIKPIERGLEHILGSYLPSPLARPFKLIASYPRYAIQLRACRAGFRQFGDRYPQKVLFVAGLPKSGTTWLEDMIASYPGYHEVYLPSVAAYELKTGWSHDYNLPTDLFEQFKDMLVVLKLHSPGSPHNINVLRKAGLKYLVLYRDLRDVAVSYFFFVRQRPWHPEYSIYAGLTLQEGLSTFAKRTLVPYANWLQSWHRNGDPSMGLEVKYEQLLAQPQATMTRIAEHLGLDCTAETIAQVITLNTFAKLSRGRTRGQESQKNFFRKGIAGDWKNHFTPELKETYKKLVGDILIDFQYEKDFSW